VCFIVHNPEPESVICEFCNILLTSQNLQESVEQTLISVYVFTINKYWRLPQELMLGAFYKGMHIKPTRVSSGLNSKTFILTNID